MMSPNSIILYEYEITGDLGCSDNGEDDENKYDVFFLVDGGTIMYQFLEGFFSRISNIIVNRLEILNFKSHEAILREMK